jgi:hypothetical protein
MTEEPATGRPTAQWSRIESGRNDDLGGRSTFTRP